MWVNLSLEQVQTCRGDFNNEEGQQCTLVKTHSHDKTSVSVPQHGQRVHAHLQPHLHDAPDRSLVGMSAVPSAHASRLPVKLVGSDQRVTGACFLFI